MSAAGNGESVSITEFGRSLLFQTVEGLMCAFISSNPRLSCFIMAYLSHCAIRHVLVLSPHRGTLPVQPWLQRRAPRLAATSRRRSHRSLLRSTLLPMRVLQGLAARPGNRLRDADPQRVVKKLRTRRFHRQALEVARYGWLPFVPPILSF